MNPSTWSAKAQSLALLLIPVIVALLNSLLKLNLDAAMIEHLFGLGIVGAGAVAVIDHGEPADPAAVAAKPVPTSEERATLVKFGVPLAGLILALFVLSGCSSLGAAYSGLTSPQGVADERQLAADWSALRSSLPPNLIPEAEGIATDVATGNYPGAIIGVLAAIPEIEQSAPALLSDVRTIIADLKRLATDATSQAVAAKASTAVAKAKARQAAKKAANPDAPVSPLGVIAAPKSPPLAGQ